MKRKGLKEMLSEIKDFDMILFTKLDRLSRNVLDANNMNKIFLDNKAYMRAVDEDDIDTSTADGMFMFNLKVSLAQREIEKTSERIKAVFQHKREKGQAVVGRKIFGYDIINKYYVINEIEQKRIIDLYEYVVKVGGDTQLIYTYFEENFKEYKTHQSLRDMLRNKNYIGVFTTWETGEELYNYIPALMSDELFIQVQNINRKRSRKPKNYTNPPVTLFDGILYCNSCKSKYSRCITTEKSGKYRVSYACWKAHWTRYNKCPECINRRSIVETKIERQLLDMLCGEIQNHLSNLKSIEGETIPKDTNKIKSKISSLESKLDKLKDLYVDDLIDKETYKRDYNKYNEELLRLKPLKYQTVKKVKKDYSLLTEIIKTDFCNILYPMFTKEEKRRFWISTLDKIYMENGLVVSLKFL